VGQEPQEFSVRLPFPFYCGRGGLANFGQGWIRMRGLHLELLNQDATAAAPDGSAASTKRRRDKSDISRAHARVAELADAPDLGSGAARRGGSSPPSRIPPQLPPVTSNSPAVTRSPRPVQTSCLGRAQLAESGDALSSLETHDFYPLWTCFATRLPNVRFASPSCVFWTGQLQDRSPEVVLGTDMDVRVKTHPKRRPVARIRAAPAGGVTAPHARGASRQRAGMDADNRPLSAPERFRGEPGKVARIASHDPVAVAI
jgi:hypothetical protein